MQLMTSVPDFSNILFDRVSIGFILAGLVLISGLQGLFDLSLNIIFKLAIVVCIVLMLLDERLVP